MNGLFRRRVKSEAIPFNLNAIGAKQLNPESTWNEWGGALCATRHTVHRRSMSSPCLRQQRTLMQDTECVVHCRFRVAAAFDRRVKSLREVGGVFPLASHKLINRPVCVGRIAAPRLNATPGNSSRGFAFQPDRPHAAVNCQLQKALSILVALECRIDNDSATGH